MGSYSLKDHEVQYSNLKIDLSMVEIMPCFLLVSWVPIFSLVLYYLSVNFYSYLKHLYYFGSNFD